MRIKTVDPKELVLADGCIKENYYINTLPIFVSKDNKVILGSMGIDFTKSGIEVIELDGEQSELRLALVTAGKRAELDILAIKNLGEDKALELGYPMTRWIEDQSSNVGTDGRLFDGHSGLVENETEDLF